MTKQQVRQKTRRLIQCAAEDMRHKIEKLLKSGTLGLEDRTDDYALPKQILTAILEDSATEWRPPCWSTAEMKRWHTEVENMRLMC